MRLTETNLIKPSISNSDLCNFLQQTLAEYTTDEFGFIAGGCVNYNDYVLFTARLKNTVLGFKFIVKEDVAYVRCLDNTLGRPTAENLYMMVDKYISKYLRKVGGVFSVFYEFNDPVWSDIETN